MEPPAAHRAAGSSEIEANLEKTALTALR